MKAVTINVQANPVMRQEDVVADVERASRLGDSIGWQEIKFPRYRQAIRDLGPRWDHVFGPEELALSWAVSELELVDNGFVKTTDGRAHITPNRFIMWAILRERAGGTEFVRFNTHAISGAWSPRPRPPKHWRQRQWRKHVAELARLVRFFADAGFPLIVGGDINRSRFRFLGDLVAYDNDFGVSTRGTTLLDYLCHRDSPRVDLQRRSRDVVRGFNSDHDAVVVDYALRPR